jgi:serine/threonine-protein kinase
VSSTALPLLMEDQTLGRYELLTPIGRGGMASVWAARLRGSHGFSKVVAIKTMLPVLSSDPRFEKMFLAEAQIAARIDHPNVCEILDVGEDRGIVYLVMNWIDGESLAGLASTCSDAGRSIPPAVAARIVAQAARGLHAAHILHTETGEPSPVIHRDVSPQNILVTCAGVVTIVDFGVARAAGRSEHTTEAGFIKGKVAYLAPEQIEGRDIDVRVDIFALGVVLYELVSGKHPFAAETDLATLLAIAAPDPAPRLADDEACPAALRAIVEQALEKDPSKRYASMRDFATALETFAAGAEKGPDDVSAFVTQMLGAQRTARAKELREAVRSADLRREQREADTGRSVSARPGPAPGSERARPLSLPPPVRRRALLFVAVGVVGIGMGVIGLRASAPPPQPLPLPLPPTATVHPTPTPTPVPPPSTSTSTSTSTSASVGAIRGVAPRASASGRAAPSASAAKKGLLDSWD